MTPHIPLWSQFQQEFLHHLALNCFGEIHIIKASLNAMWVAEKANVMLSSGCPEFSCKHRLLQKLGYNRCFNFITLIGLL